MELAFSSDQRELLDAFEQFFSRESVPAVVRRAEPLGHDESLWSKLDAMEVWGSGASVADLAVMAETAGRWIAPVPFVEHAVASPLLPSVMADASIATISLRPADGSGLWRLVPAGAVADVVIGVDGDDLVAVRSTAPGTGPHNHASAPLADRSSRDGERIVIGTAADFADVLACWQVLTAASLVGVASIDAGEPGICDVTHNQIDDPQALASMAFLFASDVAAHATDRSLHFHGGYGFAEEYDIQLYYRRARGWSLILGDPDDEYRSLADRFWPLSAKGPN
jgi:hypothetical protein